MRRVHLPVTQAGLCCDHDGFTQAGYFRERVSADLDFAPAYQARLCPAAAINAVSQDPTGIGYGRIGYVSDVRAVSVIPSAGVGPIEPIMENVLDNRYPLSRNLYFDTIGEPSGLSAEFVSWVLGPQGRQVVEEVGYYPRKAGDTGP